MYKKHLLPLLAASAAPHLVIAAAWAQPASTRSETAEPELIAAPPATTADVGDQAATGAPSSAQAITTSPNTAPEWSLGGYVEGYYQWNFNDPTNDITNFRGFDNRHNSFTLSNAVLDAQWNGDRVFGRLALQVGHTPSTYYSSEPTSDGGSGANASDAGLWKYLQQAYVGYHFGPARQLRVSAGLFLSPIGPEAMAVHENWHWSRSNLFFGLPFYHTGGRASYALADSWSLSLGAYNGWNSVVDNNAEKSLSTQLVYSTPELTWSALYFGGVERPRGAPEGRAWRHLFDTHVTWNATSRLSLMTHVNAGFEPNAFGVSRWTAAAVSARVNITAPLFVAARGDVFLEHRAKNADGEASALFWPAAWVSSGTVSLNYRPSDYIAFVFEYRHDQAASDLFFGKGAERDRSSDSFVPNRSSQDTVMGGITSWF